MPSAEPGDDDEQPIPVVPVEAKPWIQDDVVRWTYPYRFPDRAKLEAYGRTMRVNASWKLRYRP